LCGEDEPKKDLRRGAVMLRKITVVALLMSLVLSITPQAWAATPLERLAEVEVSLFGAPQAGALLQRLNHAEATLFGKPVGSQDPIVVRIEKLARLVTGSGASGASLIMKLNAAEWMIFQDQTMAIPLFDRLEKIEKDVYGDPSQGIGVEERINDLVSLVWPGGVLNTLGGGSSAIWCHWLWYSSWIRAHPRVSRAS
jgi:hypothetical protein